MSVVINGSTINSAQSTGKRVLEKRNSKNDIILTDADITYTTGYNTTAATKNITFDFGTILDSFYVRFNMGSNALLLKEFTNVKSFTKNLSSGEDGNQLLTGDLQGFSNNYIYFKNISDVTSITATAVNVFGVTFLSFKNYFPNLKTMSITGALVNYNFLSKAPVEKLTASSTTITVLDGLLLSNLRWFYLSWGITTAGINLATYLPSSLRYLKIATTYAFSINLGDLFKGNLRGYYHIGGTYQDYTSISYNGNAKFPSVIDEEPNMPIEYILYIPNISNKLTGDKLSQFLIDFANQVQSVTTANKKIRVVGGVPNESYTSSNPLHTISTYIAARDFISNTLKVNIAFS